MEIIDGLCDIILSANFSLIQWLFNNEINELEIKWVLFRGLISIISAMWEKS